jgi:hypothetical protein
VELGPLWALARAQLVTRPVGRVRALAPSASHSSSSVPPPSTPSLSRAQEGTESVISGHVEVALDNSDGRLAVEGSEVVLRRSLGLKKDDFYINAKRVEKVRE